MFLIFLFYYCLIHFVRQKALSLFSAISRTICFFNLFPRVETRGYSYFAPLVLVFLFPID
jgi:hypothetical protein